MPYDARIISSAEFIRFDAEGHLDMEATRTMFKDVMWACVHSGVGHVLVDVRNAVATTPMTTAQVCKLADVCREITSPGRKYKIAILNEPPDGFDRAALLARTAQGKGWNVAAFREFEDAFNWLSGGKELVQR